MPFNLTEFNLLLLGSFKYANFFFDSISTATAMDFNLQHIILLLAISFYTFEQITYLVDTSKGLTEPHGRLEYAFFVSFSRSWLPVQLCTIVICCRI